MGPAFEVGPDATGAVEAAEEADDGGAPFEVAEGETAAAALPFGVVPPLVEEPSTHTRTHTEKEFDVRLFRSCDAIVYRVVSIERLCRVPPAPTVPPSVSVSV